ncbi:MAG: PSD1 and planctomycete cytochrome C domain-containing protein [Pirellulales bacterium]
MRRSHSYTSAARAALALAGLLWSTHIGVTADVADDHAAVAAQSTADTPAFSAEQIEFFERKVRPLLAARCFECHAAKKQESGLRLDSRASLITGSDDGPVVDLAAPLKSKLLDAIGYEGDTQMPPEKKLADDDIATLRQWIEMGAPWNASATPVLTEEQLFEQARASHWAFQPIRAPAIPDVKQPQAAAGPIDRFILARLDAANLAPSPAADRRTLIRRLSFDLIGLPPTPDDVESFVADESPDAAARLVDRLLASPSYGERWGRHWLDVARYADTRGYAFGRERRFAYSYTYRDYVIRALNADLPFDRFVTEQLAADRLELGEDKRPLAALGFLTVGRHFDNVPDDMDERIDTVTRGFLGLTVSCARCHDHKFDPIPAEDYYSLYGVFASTKEPEELPIIGEPTELAAFAEYQKKLDALQKEYDDYLGARYAELLDAARRRTEDYLAVVATKPAEMFRDREFALALRAEDLKPRLLERWRAYIAQRAKPDHPVFGPWRKLMDLQEPKFAEAAPSVLAAIADDEKLNPQVKAALAAAPPTSREQVGRLYGKLFADVYAKANEKDPPPGVDELRKVMLADDAPTAIPKDQTQDYFNREERNHSRELKRKIDGHQVRSRGAPPRAMMLVDAPQPFDPYVFVRGNQHRHGKKVPRQFLKVLSNAQRKPFADGSGRAELAAAITAQDNPLTARVIVNRLWMHHVGQPIVATPSDFGLRSDPPTHPELLDYLADRLRSQGWSLKQLHREIVLSNTYQQQSADRVDATAADPENRLVWRINRRRLEFEPLRDALAAAAGSLDLRQGGPPVDLVAQPFTTRRAVYGFIDRQDLPGLFRAFDFASPDQSTAQRPQTTVPQQALFLMNSAFVAEQAGRLATRRDIANTGVPLAQPVLPAARIDAMYRSLFGRPPSEQETALGVQFIAANGSPEVAWTRYAQALLMSNEFCFVD